MEKRPLHEYRKEAEHEVGVPKENVVKKNKLKKEMKAKNSAGAET
jgi:hypothetical protein